MSWRRLPGTASPKALCLLLGLFLATLAGGTSGASADEIGLQLEVFINQHPTKLIAAFTQLDDGTMAATRAELTELGLLVVQDGAPDELIAFAHIPGLSYEYDERNQTIALKVPEGLLIAKEYSATRLSGDIFDARTDFGGILNYRFFSTFDTPTEGIDLSFEGGSLALTGRVFGKFGVLTHSGNVLFPTVDDPDYLRLDTAYSYSDIEHMRRYQVGDTITGGLNWSRPIRIGGVQVNRNFGLRPDLITHPIPSVDGTARVPSTVDVYIDNVKVFARDVDAGPFRITDLPILSNLGTARIVVRDSTGREVVTNQPIYSSPKFLRPGLYDFSVEAGFPRLSFASSSDKYASNPVFSATLRKGVHENLTLEGHVEIGPSLVNGGVGVVTGSARIGTVAAALSASNHSDGTGLQGLVSLDTRIRNIDIHARSQFTLGDYRDLAALTFINGEPARAPPRVLNTFSVSAPLPFDRQTRLSASLIQARGSDLERSDLATFTLSRSMRNRVSLTATGLADLRDSDNYAVQFNLSKTWGENINTTASLSSKASGTDLAVTASKPLKIEPGSFGWQVRAASADSSVQDARLAYRAKIGRAEASVSHRNGLVRATAEFDGAIASVGGSFFATNAIQDSFAVVDTGVEGVDVMHDNRPIGKTNSRGKILVSTMRGYEKNRISIDPNDVPLMAELRRTHVTVVPAGQAGVKVDMGIKTDTRSAIVVLVGSDRRPLDAGFAGSLKGGEDFVVGYDGQVFAKGLGAQNEVTVELDDGLCVARFKYRQAKGVQQQIGPVVCHRRAVAAAGAPLSIVKASAPLSIAPASAPRPVAKAPAPRAVAKAREPLFILRGATFDGSSG